MSANETQNQIFEHDRFKVAGGVLPNAFTAYRTYGDPSNPCIVFPTCYGAKMALGSQDYLVGEGKALDPSKYYVVTFALFGNGESSSPSNTPAPHNGPYFPFVSYEDNIRAQYVVLTKKLGVKKVFCVVGFSMGGQQAYHWPVVYPDFVERMVSICSAARTSPHNKWTSTEDTIHLLRNTGFERLRECTALGHMVRLEHGYQFNGFYPDLHSWLREAWEGRFVANWDANDMLTLLHTWQSGDISIIRDGGDLEKALKAIKAKCLIMPCKTDLYFPPEDSTNEVAQLKDGKLTVIDSVWGHTAGGGSNVKDAAFLNSTIKVFLDE